MKVVLIILSTDVERGGAERYTVDLAGALAERGYEVSLVSGNANAQEGPESMDHQIRQIRFPCRGLTRSARYHRFTRQVEDWLAENPQDIIHAMLPMPICNLYHPHAGSAVDALRGKPLQTLFNPRRRLFAEVERKLLAQPDPPVVLSLSDYVGRDFLKNHVEFPRHQLKRLFNAVNLQDYQPPEERIVATPAAALIVAQSYKRKGLATAIRALVDVPGTTLTVVGREPPGPYLTLAEKLGVADRVCFAGPQRDVRPFYQTATFLVLPTRHDPCSLVVLESLACGLPVISTKFNGACEVMRDGTHGFILEDPDDTPALAAAMRRLSDPAVAASMRAACEALRPSLSWEAHLDALTGIYHDINSQRSRS